MNWYSTNIYRFIRDWCISHWVMSNQAYQSIVGHYEYRSMTYHRLSSIIIPIWLPQHWSHLVEPIGIRRRGGNCMRTETLVCSRFFSPTSLKKRKKWWRKGKSFFLLVFLYFASGWNRPWRIRAISTKPEHIPLQTPPPPLSQAFQTSSRPFLFAQLFSRPPNTLGWLKRALQHDGW